jgi:formylglycine-generating enzyme required for sulfatase activity
MVLLAVLAACAPGATPTDTPTSAAVPAASDTPTLVAVTTEPGETATPTLVPVNLEGPPMEVGSTWVYVDLTTIVAVPAGKFVMGHGGDDDPVHDVTLADYWIYQTEVTNRQYALCVNVGNCTSPDPKTNPTFDDPYRSNDPVVGVNWQQAADYCTWVHGRLPTEAEWEKFARGPNGNPYPWGEKTPSCDLANYNLCKGKTTDVVTHPLGKSYYDGLDLAGNVYEWVADWYLSTYYGQAPAEDPLGPENGTKRSIRSNSFLSNAFLSESAWRFRDDPKAQRNDLGFRCVVEDPTFFAPFCEAVGIVGTGPGGGGPGGVPSPVCPSVSINQNQLECHNQVSTTNAIFNSSDPAAVVDPGTCGTHYDLAPFPEGYNCSTGTLVSIKAFCTYTDPGPATCAMHYNLNSGTGMCEWDGTGSINDECLPGFNYDPVHQCCSATPGSAGDYPLCPPGHSPVEGPPGTFKCMPGSDPGFVQDTELITIKSCEGPGGCQPPPSGCPTGQGYQWDPDKCCCASVYGGYCQPQ